MAQSPALSMSLRDRAMRSVHAQREGFTMMLYMSIITLAVLVADGPPGKARDDVALIIGTAVGTLAAHLLAFRLAARYFESTAPSQGVPAEVAASGAAEAAAEGAVRAAAEGRDTGHAEDAGASIYALVSATAVVVVMASLPYFVFSLETANAVSTGLLSLIIGASAWAVAKAGGRTTSQSLVYAVVVTAVAFAIAILKDILVH